MSRTRVRLRAETSDGTYRRYRSDGLLITSFNQSGDASFYRSVVTDEFGQHDQPFTVTSYTVRGNRFGCDFKDASGNRAVVKNWVVDNSMMLYDHVSDPSAPSNSSLAVLALKRTNPSKPMIDLPVALAELRDLPSLVKSAGETIAEKFAHGTLQREFGWAPFMGDLRKLLKFKEKVQKRVELLQKFKEGPMIRKAKLYDSVVFGTIPADRSISTGGPGGLTATCTSFKTFRDWYGYVVYTPNADMSKLINDPASLHAKARDIIGGLTIDASTVWQAMPWSWLVDWFGNMGDYLEAHRNLLPLSASTPRICKPTKTTVTLRLNGNAITGPLGVLYSHERETKSREIASASLPAADFPFLTGRQINILASLAILRGKGASHL